MFNKLKGHDKKNPVKTERKLKKEKQKEQNKRIKNLGSVIDIIPIIGLDKNQGCFITRDGKYIDFIQVISKDLTNAGSDVIQYDVMTLEKAFKLYKGNLKIIFTNFPTDTTKQINYFKNRIKNETNPVYIASLKEKQQELEYLQKYRSSREFYIMLFSNSLEENIENMNALSGMLGYMVKDIDLDKKIKILNKMANKNITTI